MNYLEEIAQIEKELEIREEQYESYDKSDDSIHKLLTLAKKMQEEIKTLMTHNLLLKSMGQIYVKEEWIPCSERLPEKDGIYDVTCKSSDRFCRRLFFHTADRSWIRDWESRHENLAEFVIAWKPLPEPWGGQV